MLVAGAVVQQLDLQQPDGMDVCRETLEELDASWCRNVTARALGQLADACPNLQTLRLFGCSQVCPWSAYEQV